MRLRAIPVILALTIVLPVNAQPRKAAFAMGVPMAPSSAVAPVVPSPRKPKQTHYDLGMYLKQNGATDAALVEFLKATQDNPFDGRAFFEQAIIFRDRGYLKLAQSALEQSLSSCSDTKQSWQARILLATVRLQQGDLEQAISELSQMLGITPPKELPYKVVKIEKIKSDDVDTEKLMASLPVMQMPHGLLPVPAEYVEAEPSTESSNEIAANESQLPATALPVFHLPASEILRGIPGLDPNASAATTEQSGPKGSSPSETRTVVKRHAENNKVVAEASQPVSSDAVDRVIAKAKSAAQESLAQEKHKTRRGFMGIFGGGPREEETKPTNSIDDIVARVRAANAANSEGGNPGNSNRANAAPGAALSCHRELSINEVYRAGAQAPAAQPTPANPAAKRVVKLQNPGKPPRPGEVALAYHHQRKVTEDVAEVPAPIGKDPWTVKLTYLAKQGTSSLKDGEAFMMSEETGEATLFLPDGQVITRRVTDGHSAEDVAFVRRPETTHQDYTYDLSLLGKILPKSKEQKQDKTNSAAKDGGGPLGWFKGVKGAFGL